MKTVSDWINRARGSTDTAEIEQCVEEAVALAESCYDWRIVMLGIADVEMVPDARVADVAKRTLEAAISERAIWGFRDVAAVRAGRLDDEAGARSALASCEARFGEPEVDGFADMRFARGYEWVLLGQGYVDILNDGGGMRRCLQKGRDMARTRGDADGLCSIATEWAKRVDREAGVALILEAERMAAGDGSLRPWTLANAWRSLDDSAAARRVLEAALEAATCSGDAVHVAQAWASHGAIDEARAAVARAEQQAATVDDWLEIAQAVCDTKLGEEVLRRSLTRAETLVRDDTERVAVSRGYSHWLQDDEAAARLGPRGVKPSELRRRVRDLPGWEASASSLFDALRAQADGEVLMGIAQADYGMDAEKHLAALRDICETGLVPRSMAWEPHEVVALTRWSSGETVDHLARALSCTLLCLSPGELDELLTNGVILADSCLALGPEACRGAESFFAWYAETEEAVDDDDPDVGSEHVIASLLLLVLRGTTEPEDARLEPLAVSLLEHRDYPLETMADWIADSMRVDLWAELVGRCLECVGESQPSAKQVLKAVVPGLQH